MKFDDAQIVDQVCWQMRQADWQRGRNRDRINQLFNGVPPYTAEEAEENGMVFNFNDLSSTRVAHDARSQFNSAFMKPGNYFRATTDAGPEHKRHDRAQIVTREVNRIMKRSLNYFECFRSKGAQNVLHGIGPAAWANQDKWCPDSIGIEDVLIPADTLLTMNNLPLFAVYRKFTAPELIRLTRNAKANSGWNMPLVKSCLNWIDDSASALMGTSWPEVWTPEKISERVKGDGGFYVGDQVPTIDCFDFYYLNEDDKESGWERRIILDSWSTPDQNTGAMSRRTGSVYDDAKSKFLFNSKSRKYASKREELISFQFADLSAVAPFRYHSVRSLGFLLYAVCHVQNRLRCKFNESVFEALMMLFRVKSLDDVQRVLKVNLYNRGFLDESMQFIPAQERFQVNSELVQLGLNQNQQLIEQNSSSYTQNQNYASDRTEKTKFQVMAEASAVNQLVSAGLNQAYFYQKFEYYEILRRFFRKNSKDLDVLRFRARVLKQGVPENMLVAEAWDLEPERVVGGGNKTMEMAITEQMMQFRNLYDPEPQRKILHDFTLNLTDDPGLADELVPENGATITDSIHDAQLAAAALMMGLPVDVKTGMNHIDYVEALMADLAILVKEAGQTGMASAKDIRGFQNIAIHIAKHMQIVAQDPAEKDRVKQWGDELGKLMNAVKGFAQRLQEKMQQQAENGNGQMDPKDAAKLQAQQLAAQQKLESTRTAHAQRTVQRNIQFEMAEKRDQQKHALDMQTKEAEAAAEIELAKAKGVVDLQIAKIKALKEPKKKPSGE